jgi:hypothetical protein
MSISSLLVEAAVVYGEAPVVVVILLLLVVFLYRLVFNILLQ